jgi:hypothetical protein
LSFCASRRARRARSRTRYSGRRRPRRRRCAASPGRSGRSPTASDAVPGPRRAAGTPRTARGSPPARSPRGRGRSAGLAGGRGRRSRTARTARPSARRRSTRRPSRSAAQTAIPSRSRTFVALRRSRDAARAHVAPRGGRPVPEPPRRFELDRARHSGVSRVRRARVAATGSCEQRLGASR